MTCKNSRQTSGRNLDQEPKYYGTLEIDGAEMAAGQDRDHCDMDQADEKSERLKEIEAAHNYAENLVISIKRAILNTFNLKGTTRRFEMKSGDTVIRSVEALTWTVAKECERKGLTNSQANAVLMDTALIVKGAVFMADMAPIADHLGDLYNANDDADKILRKLDEQEPDDIRREMIERLEYIIPESNRQGRYSAPRLPRSLI